MFFKTKLRLHEPFNGLSHLAGALLSCVALVALIVWSKGDNWKVTSFAIYGASLIILYMASALYHLLPVGPEMREMLRRFDQCAIYLLIAGSYTPVCLVPMRGPWGWTYLCISWSIALVGIVTQIFWPKMPIWLHIVLYSIMGWQAIFGFHALTHSLSPAAVRWLFGGGIIYTIGAVVFATERPRLWPKVFGFHELWHVFVLAGSAAHFMVMLSVLKDSPRP